MKLVALFITQTETNTYLWHLLPFWKYHGNSNWVNIDPLGLKGKKKLVALFNFFILNTISSLQASQYHQISTDMKSLSACGIYFLVLRSKWVWQLKG